MGIAEKNNAQLHWHNGLTPNHSSYANIIILYTNYMYHMAGHSLRYLQLPTMIDAYKYSFFPKMYGTVCPQSL